LRKGLVRGRLITLRPTFEIFNGHFLKAAGTKVDMETPHRICWFWAQRWRFCGYFLEIIWWMGP